MATSGMDVNRYRDGYWEIFWRDEMVAEGRGWLRLWWRLLWFDRR